MAYKQGILNLYKKIGETPLESILRFKENNPDLSGMKFTYAGRLDPMAHGVLPVIYGETIDEKNKKEFLSLDKEYVFKFLLGFSTDTFDILGEVVEVSELKEIRVNRDMFEEKSKEFIGVFKQKYPPYSSKTLGGIPLFSLTREGRDFKLPEKEVKISSIEILQDEKIKKEELLKIIMERISLVTGDFRQERIKGIWEKSLNKVSSKEFPIFSIKVVCSSGTYIRALADAFQKSIKIPGLAFEILRTRVGNFYLADSIK